MNFSADRLFTDLHLFNASLYEWPDRQRPITIWLTTCTRVLMSLSKWKNIVINKYYNSINTITFKYYTAVNSLNFIYEGNAQLSIRLNEWGLRNHVISSAGVRWTASPSTLNNQSTEMWKLGFWKLQFINKN